MRTKLLLRLGRERKRIVKRLAEIDRQLEPLIKEHWLDGWSFQDIADVVGHTRQRVHQVVRYGGKSKRD